MVDTIRVAQGDAYSNEVILKYADKTIIDLSAATIVQLVLTNDETDVVDYIIDCTVVDAVNGKIQFELTSTQTATKAMYVAAFKVRMTDAVVTVPDYAEQGLWVF